MQAATNLNLAFKKLKWLSVSFLAVFIGLLFFFIIQAYLNKQNSSKYEYKKNISNLISQLNDQLAYDSNLIEQSIKSGIKAKSEDVNIFFNILQASVKEPSAQNAVKLYNKSQTAGNEAFNYFIYSPGYHEELRSYLNDKNIKGYIGDRFLELLNSAGKTAFKLSEITDSNNKTIKLAYSYNSQLDVLVCAWYDVEQSARRYSSLLMQYYAGLYNQPGKYFFYLDRSDNLVFIQENIKSPPEQIVLKDSKLLSEMRLASTIYGVGVVKTDSIPAEISEKLQISPYVTIYLRYIPEADWILGIIEDNQLSAQTPTEQKMPWLTIIFFIALGIIISFVTRRYAKQIRRFIRQDLSSLINYSEKGKSKILPEPSDYHFQEIAEVEADIYLLIQQKNQAYKERESAEQRYHNLFQSNSIPLWEKDITAFLAAVSQLLSSSENELNARINLISREKWFSYLRLIKNNDVNLAVLNLFGYSSRNDLFTDVDPILAADDCFLLKELVKALHSQRRMVKLEKSVTTFNGKELDLLVTISFRTALDKSTILISLVDISRQKNTTRIIEEEKEFVLSTLSNITDGVIAIDRYSVVTLINAAALNFFNIDQEHLIGLEINELLKYLNGSSKSEINSLVKRVLSSGHTAETQEPLVLNGHNGNDYLVIPIVVAVLDGDGKNNGAVITFKDISNQKKLENEMITMKNMETIGNLSGGFAHEFNNYLQAILGNITLAGIYSADNPKVVQKVNSAKDLCLKAKAVTQRLLTFSLLGKPDFAEVLPGDFIKQTVSEILKDSSAIWQLNAQEGLHPVKIDLLQIKQVMEDLIAFMLSNSPDNAKIFIDIDNYHHLDNALLPLVPGDYIRITCLEKGAELPDEVLRRIFDPYFTNKDIGVGLALASAYYTVVNHHGFIEAFSKSGLGYSFRFYLPVVHKTVSFILDDELSRGRKKILVMDDDEQIRELASEMLSYSGFDTVGAVEGADAVRKYEEHLLKGNPFDLVIIDLHVNSGMNGQETMLELKKIDPNVKAVVSSGFGNDKILDNYQEYGFLAKVNKPYAFQELLKAIKSVLNN